MIKDDISIEQRLSLRIDKLNYDSSVIYYALTTTSLSYLLYVSDHII